MPGSPYAAAKSKAEARHGGRMESIPRAPPSLLHFCNSARPCWAHDGWAPARRHPRNASPILNLAGISSKLEKKGRIRDNFERKNQVRRCFKSMRFFFERIQIKEKVCFTFSNYHESLVFLQQLRNRVLHLPQLFKPCILPHSSGFEDYFATVTAVCYGNRVFVFFFF